MADMKWWQKAVFYQIYPRSFADGNGDGIGDLPGIISRLDYLKDLGVDALWLSPHYPSPLVDCGYDVADYTGVAEEYGTLEDFRRFLDGAHARGLRLILDLVLNHTSDRHPWFEASRSSRQDPKRDWYVWRDGRNGGPPNNWLSTFGGPAWELDHATGQYYYHFFFKEQPDLNWRNPQVQAAFFDGVRFWLDMGVDGFRIDAIGTVFEEADLADQTSGLSQADLYRLGRLARSPEDWDALHEKYLQVYGKQHDLPEIHPMLRQLRRLVDEYPGDRVLVGETEDVTFYGDGSDEMHMVFNFPLMRTDRITAPWVRQNQRQRQAALPAGAWPANTLGNHDSPRIWSRYCGGEHPAEIARLNLALLLTLRGTPFLYNGEEIGMSDYLLEREEQIRDSLSHWLYRMEREAMGAGHMQALREALRAGRDKCRTPMQWGRARNGGFCPPEVEPWLPVNPDWAQGVNVADQEEDPGSLLNFYRTLLHLRRDTPALVSGAYMPLLEVHPDVLAYLRSSEDGNILVLLNYSSSRHTVRLDGLGALVAGLRLPSARPLFASHRPLDDSPDLLNLPVEPFEILILDLRDTG